ncbi:hypothetical protein ACFXK0_13025 [Nocardia sp. NPDC059177]|uniref:hypothetical protein n=1 Tax=Nocardia sp. NPDC059177 TaxID=3346759 RepID=UPI0036994E6D
MSVAAASLAVSAPFAVGAPEIPMIDQIASGSAAPGAVTAPGDGQRGWLELELGLESGSGWSAVPTGSAAGIAPDPADGQALGLGESDHGGIDVAGPTSDPDPDLVLPACVGSAAVGSAALGSGIVTGSGMGSSLVGLGSSGSAGSGSAGAGSVAVGSAAAGSAALTCLLLLPVPSLPAPGSPLTIPPAALRPAAVPVPARLPEVIPTIPGVIPPLPPAAGYAAPVQPPPAPALTALQVMTVMIITIIAGARARLRGR